MTAKHCVEALNGLGGKIELHIGRSWKQAEALVVGQGHGKADIAVLSCSENFPDPPELTKMEMGILYAGLEIQFVGFPLGLMGDVGDVYDNLPFPFVKRGIISCFMGGEDGAIAIDGMNAPGFSGGPFYFLGESDDLKIGGVISSYRHNSVPVLDGQGNKTSAFVQVNTGIMFAYGIKYVTDIMDNASVT